MFERFTERARHAIVLAQDEARTLKHNYIGTEHVLLGLVRENEGVGARILLDFDADAEKIRNEIIRMLSGSAGERAPRKGEPWIIVYCPSCHTPIESIGTEMAPGRFSVEGDGTQTCRGCGAVWHLSYRVDWRMAGDEGG